MRPGDYEYCRVGVVVSLSRNIELYAPLTSIHHCIVARPLASPIIGQFVYIYSNMSKRSERWVEHRRRSQQQCVVIGY